MFGIMDAKEEISGCLASALIFARSCLQSSWSLPVLVLRDRIFGSRQFSSPQVRFSQAKTCFLGRPTGPLSWMPSASKRPPRSRNAGIFRQGVSGAGKSLHYFDEIFAAMRRRICTEPDVSSRSTSSIRNAAPAGTSLFSRTPWARPMGSTFCAADLEAGMAFP